MIKFENINVTYPGGVEALKDLNLEINEGDFIIIVGPVSYTHLTLPTKA